MATLAMRRPCVAGPARLARWLRPRPRLALTQGQAPCAGSARRRPSVACEGLVPGFGAALRYDERARREALMGRRPQPTAGAAVTRRPCGDPIKKAPSARAAARRQLRVRGTQSKQTI